jgi:hypothetical protein
MISLTNIVVLDDNVRHVAMRSSHHDIQRRAGQATSFGDGLKCGCIGIGRAARLFNYEVARGARLSREPEAPLSIAALLCSRAARRRRDDKTNQRRYNDQLAHWVSAERVSRTSVLFRAANIRFPCFCGDAKPLPFNFPIKVCDV